MGKRNLPKENEKGGRVYIRGGISAETNFVKKLHEKESLGKPSGEGERRRKDREKKNRF